MISLKILRLIESHSEQLAHGLVEKILGSERTSDFRRLDATELRRSCHEFYKHLNEWLLIKTESDIELRFTQLGSRRAEQDISPSHWIWALVLAKDHLWGLLQREAWVNGAVELYGELEFLRLLEQFFDRAMYYGTVGYERAGRYSRAGDRRRAA